MLADAQRLYKHVDENGHVTYTDRPPLAGQKPEKEKTRNVASPEANRQMRIHQGEVDRERRAEEVARMRRYADQRRYEMEKERERRAREADPNRVEQAPARPRVRSRY
jgi:hypothetical protein